MFLKNFKLKEIFSKKMIETHSESELIALLDMNYFRDFDDFCSEVKKELGCKSVICNNWAFGGRFDDRGYRGKDSDTGGVGSMHRFGKAADVEFYDVNKKEIPEKIIIDFLIKKKKEGKYKNIRRVEIGSTWFHSDSKDAGVSLYGFHISDKTKSKTLLV